MHIITDSAGYLNRAPSAPFGQAKLSALLYLASRRVVSETIHPLFDDTFTFDGKTIKGAQSWDMLEGAIAPTDHFLCLSVNTREALEHTVAACGHMTEDALARYLNTLPEVQANPASITLNSILKALGHSNADEITEEYDSLMRAQRFLQDL